MARHTPALSAYQHDTAGTSKAQRFELKRFDPSAKPLSCGDKLQDKIQVGELAQRINQLQNLFYADHRFKLLLVLQGSDTSGKDGTIRDVFGQTSALGVHAVGWKAPSDDEKAHDFLWRIHQKAPAAGEIVIFNRSHYEDVLVPRVTGQLTASQLRQRYAQINDFERMLSENGTVICKFMLHISKDEQRRRLQERLDDPQKHWKFALSDLEARQQWDAYQRGYNDAIAATGTPWAPWIVVPADSKTHRNLMVGTAVVALLHKLKLRYPHDTMDLTDLRIV